MIAEIPIYETRNCSPMCNHQEECVRCHSPHCIKSMHHTRLHGYICNCGSQEWKSVWLERGLTKRPADGQYLCARCGHPESDHPVRGCAAFARR